VIRSQSKTKASESGAEEEYFSEIGVSAFLLVIAGPVPAIHVFDSTRAARHGCPAQGRGMTKKVIDD
jgi:hypothetical protein